jgi:hypothetical protein
MQNIWRAGHKIRIRWLFQEDPKNPKKKTKNTIAAEKVMKGAWLMLEIL